MSVPQAVLEGLLKRGIEIAQALLRGSAEEGGRGRVLPLFGKAHPNMTASAHVDAPLAAIDSSLINRTIVGVAGGNVLRGLIWGNVAAVSQALGTSFAEQYAAATAAKQAISLPALRAGFGARITTFWPIIVGHTVFFSVYRGSVENQKGAFKTGALALVQPLVVTAIPTLAYAAYTRAMPSQALRFGLYSCVLLHLYDRVLHPKGLNTELMPMARLNRRVW